MVYPLTCGQKPVRRTRSRPRSHDFVAAVTTDRDAVRELPKEDIAWTGFGDQAQAPDLAGTEANMVHLTVPGTIRASGVNGRIRPYSVG